MTETQIEADVDRGLEIHGEMAALKAELKKIEARLTEAGLEGPTVPLVDEAREGRQFLAHGSRMVLPVVLESDLLVSSFPPKSPVHVALAEICGDGLKALYRSTTKYERVPKDGAAFRKVATEVLGSVSGAAAVSAALQRDKHGVARSRIVIAWERAGEAL